MGGEGMEEDNWKGGGWSDDTRIQRKEKQGQARWCSKMGWVTQHVTLLGTKTHVNIS